MRKFWILVLCGIALAVGGGSHAAAGGASAAPAAAAGSVSGADTIILEGCSYAEVKAALASAPQGATIEVGEGECTWFDNATNPSLFRYGSVHLKGKGIGRTIIHAQTPECGATGCDTETLLTFRCVNAFADAVIEVSGFSFVGNLPPEGWTGGLTLQGCHDFLIHDNRFERFKGQALTLTRNVASVAPRGVVYANQFLQNVVTGTGYGVSVHNEDQWPDFRLGDQNSEATIVEDNCFMDNRHSMTANNGAEYVFRYNTVVNTPLAGAWPPVDAHGVQKTGQRGTRSWEIYRNLIRFQGGTSEDAAIGIRGGDGVAWGNRIDSAYPSSILFRLEWFEDSGSNQCLNPDNSYPADHLDQTRKAWLWGNTWGAGPQTVGVAPGCAAYFHEDIDYFQRMPTAAELGGHAYVPHPYPHPARGSDRLFGDGFEGLADLCSLVVP